MLEQHEAGRIARRRVMGVDVEDGGVVAVHLDVNRSDRDWIPRRPHSRLAKSGFYLANDSLALGYVSLANSWTAER